MVEIVIQSDTETRMTLEAKLVVVSRENYNNGDGSGVGTRTCNNLIHKYIALLACLIIKQSRHICSQVEFGIALQCYDSHPRDRNNGLWELLIYTYKHLAITSYKNSTTSCKPVGMANFYTVTSVKVEPLNSMPRCIYCRSVAEQCTAVAVATPMLQS